MADFLKAFIEFFADIFAAIAVFVGSGSSFDDLVGSVDDVLNALN